MANLIARKELIEDKSQDIVLVLICLYLRLFLLADIHIFVRVVIYSFSYFL